MNRVVPAANVPAPVFSVAAALRLFAPSASADNSHPVAEADVPSSRPLKKGHSRTEGNSGHGFQLH